MHNYGLVFVCVCLAQFWAWGMIAAPAFRWDVQVAHAPHQTPRIKSHITRHRRVSGLLRLQEIQKEETQEYHWYRKPVTLTSQNTARLRFIRSRKQEYGSSYITRTEFRAEWCMCPFSNHPSVVLTADVFQFFMFIKQANPAWTSLLLRIRPAAST